MITFLNLTATFKSAGFFKNKALKPKKVLQWNIGIEYYKFILLLFFLPTIQTNNQQESMRHRTSMKSCVCVFLGTVAWDGFFGLILSPMALGPIGPRVFKGIQLKA